MSAGRLGTRKMRPSLQVLLCVLGVNTYTTTAEIVCVPEQGALIRVMARLSLEEKGLLQILERVERGELPSPLSVRQGLVNRGLIEGEPPKLTLKGELALDELRLRPVRETGEFPSLLLAEKLQGKKP